MCNLNDISDATVCNIFIKALNIYFPLKLISLNVVERSLLHKIIPIIVGANEIMLNTMPLRHERLIFLKLLTITFHFPLVILFYLQKK